jgi:DNA polymerase III delta prime subunit
MMLPENYDHMVAWMQRKLKNAPIKDRQMFGNLVRTKLLNEKITPSSTSKEIRRLKIKEASIRAERDKSLEVLEEIETKLKDVTARSPLEIRILAKKLGEAKYIESDVQLLCKKLEERQLKLNETLAVVEKLNESIKEVGKKSVSIKESIKESMKEEHAKEITSLTKSITEKCNKQLVEKYTGLKLSHTGLKVHRNSRALLEKCNSAEDVDKVFEDIKEGMRIAHFASPPGIDKIRVLKEKKQNSGEAKTTSLVKNAMRGMY